MDLPDPTTRAPLDFTMVLVVGSERSNHQTWPNASPTTSPPLIPDKVGVVVSSFGGGRWLDLPGTVPQVVDNPLFFVAVLNCVLGNPPNHFSKEFGIIASQFLN